METNQKLDMILEEWNLLKHPFYQAWSEGSLPVEALKVYAEEYGSLINILANGWTTLNDPETSQEEREHAEMWEQFAAALGTTVGVPKLSETRDLLDTTRALFQNPDSTLGAMYAFEAQQPSTARSKLDGLRRHYSLPAEVEPYFEVHSANWHESEKLLERISALPESEQNRVIESCEQMAQSLWKALTGIHEQTS